jgi:hypothetical protein
MFIFSTGNSLPIICCCCRRRPGRLQGPGLTRRPGQAGGGSFAEKTVAQAAKLSLSLSLSKKKKRRQHERARTRETDKNQIKSAEQEKGKYSVLHRRRSREKMHCALADYGGASAVASMYIYSIPSTPEANSGTLFSPFFPFLLVHLIHLGACGGFKMTSRLSFAY